MLDVAGAIIERVDMLMERLPTEGRVAGRAASILSRIALLAETLSNTAELVECLVRARDKCSSSGSMQLCVPECAGIHLLREGENVRLWRLGGNSFTASFTPTDLRIGDNRVTVKVNMDKLIVALPSSGGVQEIEADLRSPEDLYKDYQLIGYALRYVENLLNKAYREASRCVRVSRLSC